MEQKIGFCNTSDGVRICYATIGEGTPLVKAAAYLNHVEFDWRSPVWRHWWEELSKDHLLVRYDQRGCGLSDWAAEDMSFGAWVTDLEVVVDTLGLDRFVLLGISQGGAVAIEYTVRHPERVSQLVLYGAYARGWARRGQASVEERQALLTLIKVGWGRDNPADRQVFTSRFMPEATAEQMKSFNELQRVSTSPDNAVRIQIEFGKIDVQGRLSRVAVPTLVLNSRGDAMVPFEEGRRVSALIPNSRFVLLEGRNHILLETEPAWQTFLSEVRGFLGVKSPDFRAAAGKRKQEAAEELVISRPNLSPHTPDGTVTILFTDIEGSTAITERLGDQRWLDLLHTHNGIIRHQLAAYGGFEVKSQGDGFMVAFQSGRRALQCAIAIQQSLAAYNNQHHEEPIRVRSGLHTGDAIKEAEDFFGKAVILAARIAAQAQSGQILVSGLLKELTESSGQFKFDEGREIELKGLSGSHRVFELEWQNEA